MQKYKRVHDFLQCLKPYKQKGFAKGNNLPTLHNVVKTMKLRTNNQSSDSSYVAPIKDVVGEKVKNSEAPKCLYPHHIAGCSGATELTSKRFLSNTLRITTSITGVMGTTAIFGSGAMNGIGALSEIKALLVLQHSRLHLCQLGYKTLVEEVCLHNKVYSGDFGHMIDIYAMEKNDMNSIICEDSFPGLIYFRVNGNRICVSLIFGSGKLILMAVRTKHSEIEIFKQLVPLVAKFKTDSKPIKNVSQPELIGMQKILGEIFNELTEEERNLDPASLKNLVTQELREKFSKLSTTVPRKRGRKSFLQKTPQQNPPRKKRTTTAKSS
jgi:TATA-box binding protein (TBP) (component of TFIID and TFIIIB)